ncbi:MAG: hypothetical protein AAB447_03005 [Patescibacteria group bacterium]
MLDLNIKAVPLDTDKYIVTASLNDQRMISIDLQLSLEEKKALQDLKIGIEGGMGNFLYWGSVDNEELPLNLKSYIGVIGEKDDIAADVISKLIVRIAEHVTKYFDTKFAWIETKTFLANDTFVIPRWHIDDKFFKPHTAYKLVWAIKGSQTRFGVTENLAEFLKLTVLEIQAGHGTDENISARKGLDQIVNEVKIPVKEAAMLYRSAGENPVVHSEPHMSENRLFLGIVPGTKAEINEWYERKRQKDVKKGVGSRKWYYNTL